MSERIPTRARLWRWRYWIYVAIVLALLVFRVVPSLRSRLPGPWRMSMPVKNELIITGLDTAPQLIPRLVAYYQTLYPKLTLQTRPGGTIQALEDLLNQRADVAILSRPLSASEDSVVRSAGESLLIFPVALAGTLVLAGSSTKLESLSVGALREILTGQRPVELGSTGQAPPRVYVSDPSLGLWGAITRQLDLSDTASANVKWVQDDRMVGQAVAQDAAAIGLVSSLAATPEGWPGCRTIRLTADPGKGAADPTQAEIAAGEYPLYHHLYASCRLGGGAQAAAFVTFVQSEKGQTLIRREGFLPAREIAREIELSQRPLGMVR